jgi:hypothetical protein
LYACYIESVHNWELPPGTYRFFKKNRFKHCKKGNEKLAFKKGNEKLAFYGTNFPLFQI